MFGLLLTGIPGWGKTVGLWKVTPRYATDTIVKTLDEADWRVVTIGTSNLVDDTGLAGLDVILIPGGWDAYRLASFKARRNLVKFVAGGKGLLDGFVNTAKCPLFPQVGITSDYVAGLFITPFGTNELAKTMNEPLVLAKCRIRVKAGPVGTGFAASGEDLVGVYGPVYGGRYILFGGAFNSMEMTKKDLAGGVAQQLLLACMDWLASAPALTAAEKSQQQAQADLDFLRVEKLSDWTHHEDRWLGQLSLIPEVRYRLALLLEKRQFALNDLGRTCSGENRAHCRALTNELHQALVQLDSRYQEVRSNMETRICQMGVAQLTEDNPSIDRHGQEIAEQLLPKARLSELTARCDKAIMEIQAMARTAAPDLSMTVAERLRNDPLMMPYYTGKILPTPQQVEYRDEFIPMAKVAVVVGRDVKNQDALVEVITDRVVRYGGQVTVAVAPGAEFTAVVSLGDTELARQVQGVPAVPEKPEGYILYCAKAAGKPLFILKGRDQLGMTWSVASLMQLIHWRDGKTMARAATVVDYPCLAKRGMILGGGDFFHPARDKKGTIISYPNTDLALRQNRLLMLVCKINEPVYQGLVSVDCYDHDWKQPDKLPADAHVEEDLAAIGKNLTPLGITWWAGIRPHATGDSSPDELSHKLCADEESVQGLLYYARKTEEVGGHLSIILDDIRFPLHPYDQERLGTACEVDTWIITNVMTRLKQEFPKARLLVGPPFYWGPVGKNPYNEDRDTYLKTIGDVWAPEIEVFWTGRQVNAATLATQEHFEWWMKLTKRKPYFWQNCCTFWCHMYRRHYPTDALDSLWSCNWDGLFDVLGWYGFNGGDIPRMCVTDAISSDFQWNPQAYGKDKQESAQRSVQEVAEKFIGQESWPLLVHVTEPLSFFDGYYLDPALVGKAEYPKAIAAINKRAAKIYPVLEAKRDAAQSAFKILQEKYPASVKAWSALGDFVEVAKKANGIVADPNLRLYRAAVGQRAVAQKEGNLTPEQDVFLAAADFDGGWLQEISEDDLAKRKLQPAMVLEGPKHRASASFPLTKEQVEAPHEMRLKGRQNAKAGRMTLTLNGKPIFDDKAPFGKMEPTTVRFPVPAGLLTETNNVLTLNLVIEESTQGDMDELDGISSGPPLAIHYAVFKCKVGNN